MCAIIARYAPYLKNVAILCCGATRAWCSGGCPLYPTYYFGERMCIFCCGYGTFEQVPRELSFLTFLVFSG